MFGFIPADKVEIFQSTPSSQKETLLVINAPLIVPSFQSTPSSQRETIQSRHTTPLVYHFNPLPPRRGRPVFFQGEDGRRAFQSTPSSQRETQINYILSHLRRNFNPLPPRRGRRKDCSSCSRHGNISIHSLIAEGDERNHMDEI